MVGRQRTPAAWPLLAGGPELRHQPALGAAPAVRADRPIRRWWVRLAAVTRRWARPAVSSSASGASGAWFLGRRSVHPQLPDDRHRVHRGQLVARIFGVSKYVAVPIACGRLIAITVSGSFGYGALDVRVRVRQLPVIRCSCSRTAHRAVAHDFVVPGIQACNSTSILLDHRPGRPTVAPWQLFLPAVEHRRQEDHPKVDQL